MATYDWLLEYEVRQNYNCPFARVHPGTEDYMAFYDFEIGEKIEILTRAEADAALNRGDGE